MSQHRGRKATRVDNNSEHRKASTNPLRRRADAIIQDEPVQNEFPIGTLKTNASGQNQLRSQIQPMLLQQQQQTNLDHALNEVGELFVPVSFQPHVWPNDAVATTAVSTDTTYLQPTQTPLLIEIVKMYAQTGDLDFAMASLESYLQGSSLVDDIDFEGRTALMYSTRPEITQLLIQHGANVNARDRYGRTALMYASSAEVATVLIAHRADLNFRDQNDLTALMHAILRKCSPEYWINLCNWLQQPVHTNVGEVEKFKNTLKCMELVRLLVSSVTRQNMNLEEWRKRNAILLAVLGGDVDIARLLIMHGADIYSIDAFGRNAAIHAVLKNDYDMLRMLVDNNINLDHIDENKKTALLYSVEPLKNDRNDMPNDSYAFAATRKPAVTEIERVKNREIVKLLIQMSSVRTLKYRDPNNKRNALIHLILQDDVENVALLLSRGKIDVNQIDVWHNTPLIYAVSRKLVKVVRLLIKHGANVNVIGFSGQTPLMLVYSWVTTTARYKEQAAYEIIQVLLGTNAVDMDIQDIDTKTVVDYAMGCGNTRYLNEFARLALESLYSYFSTCRPEKIRADVYAFVHNRSDFFPIQHAHVQMLDYFYSNILLIASDDFLKNLVYPNYNFIVYFISVDFQEKLLSDVRIRLSEDMIEIGRDGSTLESRLAKISCEEIIDIKEHSQLENTSKRLALKRADAEHMINLVDCMTPFVLRRIVNQHLILGKRFETNLNDEFSNLLEEYLKNLNKLNITTT